MNVELKSVGAESSVLSQGASAVEADAEAVASVRQLGARGDRTRVLELARYAFLGGLALGIITSFDIAFGPNPTLKSVCLGFLLGCSLGTGGGALFGLGVTLLSRAPRYSRYLPASIIGGLLGHGLVQDLMIFPKLNGPNAKLAWLSLVATCAAAVMTSALIAGCQVLASKSPRERALSAGTRFGFVALLAAVASMLIWADYNILPDLYISAHRAMRALVVLSIFAAVLLLASSDRSSRARLAHARAAKLVPLAAASLMVLALGLPYDRSDFHATNSRLYGRRLLALARSLLDFDADGYSSLLGGGDCAPFDPTIFPFATDIAGNGVDEDCSGADAPARRRPLPSALSEQPTASPSADNLVHRHIVLITVDTLRADRAVDPVIMPALTNWGQTTLRFERAYSPLPATMPALGSLFCGRYPRELPWQVRLGTSAQRMIGAHERLALGDDERVWYAVLAPTEDACDELPTVLRREGFLTTAVVAGSVPFLAKREHAVARGFERYEALHAHPEYPQDDVGTTKLAMEVLATLPSDRPTFTWIHYFGPHDPSEHHIELGPYPSGVAARYDHEVRYTDLALAPLLAQLDELAASAPTFVVLTSDHGEELTGATRHHGRSVHDDVTRVPLFVKSAGLKPRSFGHPVSMIDIMPTVLSAAGLPASSSDGVDLTLLVNPENEALAARREVVTEAWDPHKDGTISVLQVALMSGLSKVRLDITTLDESAHDVSGYGEGPVDWAEPRATLRGHLRDFVHDAPVAAYRSEPLEVTAASDAAR